MKTIKKHMTRILGIVLAAVMLIGAAGPVDASAAEYLKPRDGASLTVLVNPGQTTHVNIPVRAADAGLMIYSIMAEPSNSLMSIFDAQLLDADGNPVSFEYGYNIYANATVSIDFDIVADDSLKIGYNTISIRGLGFYFGDEFDFTPHELDLMTISTYTATELEDAYITASDVSYNGVITPGNAMNMRISVKNEGDVRALNTFMTLDFGSSGIIPDYTVSKIRVGELASKQTASVNVPIKVLSTAEPGLYKITANFTCKNKAGNEKGPFSQDIYVTIVQEKSENGPDIEFTTKDNYKEITPNTDDVILLSLENKGKGKASNISITCSSGFDTTSGITKRYTTDSVAAKDLRAEKSTTVEIPVSIAKSISSGLHELSFKLSYTDESGMVFSKNLTMYLRVPEEIKEEQEQEETVRNYITIKNASQSPSAPVAGEKVTVSFDVVNDGTADISNLRFCGQSLGSNGFEPVSNEPYTNVGTLAKGASKHVNMTFRCGEFISDGMNSLTIGYDYVDAKGAKQADTMTLYILNVKSTVVDVGRPKLIVNAYGTDQEVLKAGEEFIFSFTLKNTHATKAAKNIKITLSQDEGVFSPASGTNIFYIEQIKAGEESTQTMKLKTRADATTGDYAVKLLVEYEYDDMSDADKERGGVSEENNIKLRATENYRPVIENIYIDAWQTVYVGNPVDLSFEFYNMGKSTLGNVYVTVEGDFELANNSQMSYIGAIQGYGQEYVNPQVVPLVAGEAKGVLVVHFEDSNGDEVTLSQDFSCYVEDMGGGEGWSDDPWSGDYPSDEPWGDDPWGGDIPEEETSKKILGLPLWAFILVCAGVAAVVTVVVIVIVKKAKKNNKVKEDDDEDY